jgi:hypothetical protein
MCDVLLPPGVNPTAVTFIYHIISIQGPKGFFTYCIAYCSLYLALRVSVAICTHPQLAKPQRIVMCVFDFGILVPWSGYCLEITKV